MTNELLAEVSLLRRKDEIYKKHIARIVPEIKKHEKLPEKYVATDYVDIVVDRVIGEMHEEMRKEGIYV